MTYQPRKIRFHGLDEHREWRLKVYSIAEDDIPIDPARFSGWRLIAASVLPAAIGDGLCFGIGFAILHQARVADYLVLCWWDNRNELPVRVFVSPAAAPRGWRPADERESFCVWDLEVVAHERNAFVKWMMAADPSQRDYLSSVVGSPPRLSRLERRLSPKLN